MPGTISQRILVTGGSGFIGTNLVEHYAATDAQVLNLDIAAPRNPAHRRHWRRVDLRASDAVRAEIQAFDPTHVLHMCARTDLDGEHIEDYAANTTGVRALVGALSGSTALERVVFSSSRMVCRIAYQPHADDDYCPNTVYGESKVEGERIVRDEAGALPWVMVRPCSIWGPWFDVPYKSFFTAIAKGRYVHPGRRSIHKSFGYVGNTVHQLDRLLTCPPDRAVGRTLYMADYPPLELADWATRIQRESGAARVRRAPIGVLRAGGWVGDGLHRMGWQHPVLTSFRVRNLLTEMVYDLGPLQDIVPELPYDLGEGVRDTVAWLRRAGEL